MSGVFFAPHELVKDKEEANRGLAVMLREAGIPVVLLDRDLTPFPARSDFDLVGIDNFAGGYMLAEHLLKLGCTRIHFVARPMSAPTVDARIAGVREALGRRGIEPERGWLHIGDLDDKKFVRALTGPLRPDAYICANGTGNYTDNSYKASDNLVLDKAYKKGTKRKTGTFIG